MPKRKGLVQVYTGNGKGKTTAALGAALRAVGQGWRVVFIQFVKGAHRGGEHRAAKGIPGLKIVQLSKKSAIINEGGRIHFVLDRDEAQKSFEYARQAINSAQYDMVVLDEIYNAVANNLVDIEQLLDLIATKPPQVELILTGRAAPPEVIEVADLVTEMKLVKHHFQKGVKARRGIEF